MPPPPPPPPLHGAGIDDSQTIGGNEYKFVKVEAPNGDLNIGDAYTTSGPAGRVEYDYSIGTYQVTIQQYCDFLNAVGQTDTVQNGLFSATIQSNNGINRSGGTGNYTYTSSLNGNLPVAAVSVWGAYRFCNWLTNQHLGLDTTYTTAEITEHGAYELNGLATTSISSLKRDLTALSQSYAGDFAVVLPDNNEWQKAAYYDPTLNNGNGGYWKYAVQDDNYTSLSTSAANGVHYSSSNPSRTIVGSYTLATSYYGAYDMSGNIQEWVESTPKDNPDIRLIRGGNWNGSEGKLTSGVATMAEPKSEAGDIGFRIALVTIPTPVPEPATYALFGALGALALAVVTRRRKG